MFKRQETMINLSLEPSKALEKLQETFLGFLAREKSKGSQKLSKKRVFKVAGRELTQLRGPGPQLRGLSGCHC